MLCTKIEERPQLQNHLNQRDRHREIPKTKKMAQTATEHKACHKCGNLPPQPAAPCPARTAECPNCGKKGQYRRVCRLASTVNELVEDTDGLFLDEVSSGEEPWRVDNDLRGSKVTFKIDTGADVTAIPEQVRPPCSEAKS